MPQLLPMPPPRIRDSLLAFADRITIFPLTLVVAPAGSGKSTLLGVWRQRLEELGESAAYLDLSPLHADAAVLAEDLVEATRGAVPGFGTETMQTLAQPSGAPDEWRSLLRAILRDWRGDANGVALVLDNFHEIAGDGSGARLVDEMLRSQVSGLQIVIASRGAVPGATARLRAASVVQELGVDEMSLRFEEVERVLAEHGVTGDADIAARVLARTQGWATGVQLAARRLARIDTARRPAFIAQLSREPDLFGFVATEVLRDEPDAVVAAVEAVAILGRCTDDMVVELLGDPAAGTSIARAVQRGVLLSEGNEVFLHQLWRDLVSERLATRLAEAERRALLQRAGTLLRQRGNAEAALEAFAAGGDWEEVGQTLIALWGPMAREGRVERLRHWLARLPEGLVEATPTLLALSGIASVRTAPQHALPILERASSMYRARGEREQERFLAGYIGVIHLAQMRREEALAALRRMITLRGVVTDPAERGSLYGLLAQRRYLTGRYGGALAMAERAARLPLDASSDWFNAMLLCWLRGIRGEIDAAFREVDRVMQRPEITPYGFTVGGASLLRARLHLLAGSHREALEEAERALACFRDHRITILRAGAATMIGYARSRLGDREDALRYFAQALERTGGGNAAEGPARVHFAIERFRWGEIDEARNEAQRALDTLGAADARWPALTPWLLCYALWLLSRCGDATAAWRLARRHRASFRLSDFGLTQHTVLLVHADIAQRAGEAAVAQRSAREAFEYGARFGVRMVEPIVGDLVTEEWAAWAIREGICAEYAMERLEAIAPARVSPLLHQLARDRNTEARASAVRLLARSGGRVSYEALREASQDRVARVRDAASAALAVIDLRPSFALRVDSFGHLEVFRGDETVTSDAWKGQTARRLFANLLAAEGRLVPREQLRSALWPDAEPEAGRNNLRVAITRLNDALDPERPSGATPHFVVAEGDGLRLHPDALADWDAARFRELLREAETAERAGEDARCLAKTREAIALYRGALLAEFDDDAIVALRRGVADRFAAAAHRIGPRRTRQRLRPGWSRRRRLPRPAYPSRSSAATPRRSGPGRRARPARADRRDADRRRRAGSVPAKAPARTRRADSNPAAGDPANSARRAPRASLRPRRRTRPARIARWPDRRRRVRRHSRRSAPPALRCAVRATDWAPATPGQRRAFPRARPEGDRPSRSATGTNPPLRRAW